MASPLGFGALPGFGAPNQPVLPGSVIDPLTGLPYSAANPAPDPNAVAVRPQGLIPIGQNAQGQNVLAAPAAARGVADALSYGADAVASGLRAAPGAAVASMRYFGDMPSRIPGPVELAKDVMSGAQASGEHGLKEAQKKADWFNRERASPTPFYNPETGHFSEETIRNATDLALEVAGASTPFKAPAGALRIFGGRNAKTADLDALARAEEMQAKGADRREIWDQTGWFQPADKQWAFDIDDSKSGMQPGWRQAPAGKDAALPNAFRHRALYEAYPEIKNTTLQFGAFPPRLKEAIGAYDGDANRIVLNAEGPYFNSNRDMRSTNLHELNHKVAELEGFAVGDNPNTAGVGVDPAVDSFRSARIAAQKAGNHMIAATMAQKQQEAMMDAYRRSAGEVAARNAQIRANLTREQRRQYPPWETQDVPDEQQIVKFGQLAPQASMGPVRAYHASSEPFSEYDFTRLGKTTLPNVKDTSVEDYSMNLANLGAWASDKQLSSRIGGSVDLPVYVGGKAKKYSSLDALEAAIRRGGGPEKFREGLLSRGFGHVKVADEEFGGTSYVGLTPDFFRMANDKADAAARSIDIGEDAQASLPMDQASRMARAKEMGFDTSRPFYHATAADLENFDLKAAGTGINAGDPQRAIFLTDNPAVADSYQPGQYIRASSPDAQRFGAADMGGDIGRYYSPGSRTFGTYVRNLDDFEGYDVFGGPYSPSVVKEALKEARQAKAPGVLFDGMRDPGIMDTVGPLGSPRRPSTILAVRDPAVIRSMFARFDPKLIKKKDLLAGVAGATAVGGASMMLPEDEPLLRRFGQF